ncbi:hypothetical protein ACVQ90_02190 [Staphylococcus aureus]
MVREVTERPIKIYNSLGVKDINIQDRKIKKVSKNKKRVDAQYKIKQTTVTLIATFNLILLKKMVCGS